MDYCSLIPEDRVRSLLMFGQMNMSSDVKVSSERLFQFFVGFPVYVLV